MRVDDAVDAVTAAAIIYRGGRTNEDASTASPSAPTRGHRSIDSYRPA
jgi:hypothetical protein